MVEWPRRKRISLATMNESTNIESQEQQIVTFINEGNSETATALPEIEDVPSTLLDMSAREERVHTIVDFLERPVVITSNMWSKTDAVGKELYRANFPEELIKNKMYQDKLKGFVGLRATLVVKVQVNSQPFQQGRLMLQYIPYAQYLYNRVDDINASLQGRSGCPRVDLDLSTGTEIEMRIPYVSPHLYYNLVTGQGSFGSVYLVVYSQLKDQASGAGAVEYTMWAYLDDVDVQFPTGANIYLGNTPSFSTVSEKMAQGQVTDVDMQTIYQDQIHKKPPPRSFAQAGGELKSLKKNASPSTGVGKISEGLTILSDLPIIGQFLKAPAWVSSKAADLLRLFGFSKPTSEGYVSEMKLRTQGRMTNFDGMDMSHRMALSSTNEIETRQGLAGSDIDEMNLTTVLSTPNYWDRFTWSTTDITKKVLWNDLVTPYKVKNINDKVGNVYVCTHLGYVANTFTYWRGSLVYNFKFVKTQFHSGRLRISFIPFYMNDDYNGDPDLSRTQSVIVDLRTQSEVSFVVPYVSTRPWTFSVKPDKEWLNPSGTQSANYQKFAAVTGTVRVDVLNKLVAAQSVNPDIDVIVEVWGGKDLEFAGPTCPSYLPCEHSAVKVKSVAQVDSTIKIIPRNEAQLGKTPSVLTTKTISTNWSPAALCVGEKIVSIRQLIKRFGLADIAVLDTKAGSMVICPYRFKPPTPKPDAESPQFFTPLDYFYNIFAFYRGSLRIKIFSSVEKLEGKFIESRVPSSWTVRMLTSIHESFHDMLKYSTSWMNEAQTDPAAIAQTNPSTLVVMPHLEGGVEFEVPYYNVSHITPGTQFEEKAKISEARFLNGGLPPNLLHIMCTDNLSEGKNVRAELYKAAGDDFSYHYLVGVPLLTNIKR